MESGNVVNTGNACNVALIKLHRVILVMCLKCRYACTLVM